MKPSLRHQVLANEVAVPPPDVAGLAALGGQGFDLMWPTYYGNNWPFINVLRQGPNYVPSLGSYRDANGWITGAPPSTAFEFTIVFALNIDNGFFPPGNYKARSASGWTLQFTSCVEVTAISAAAVNQAFCTVPDKGPLGVYQTEIRVTATSPATAGPHSLNDLEVYKENGSFAATEALIAAGEIFDPTWLTNLGNPKCVRTKDWLAVDGAERRVVNYSELVLESDRSWQMDGFLTNVPYTVCAKLAKKLNCVLFFSASLLDCGYFYTSDASTDRINATGHEFVDGDEFVFNSYGNGDTSGTGCPLGVSTLTRYFVRDVVAGVSFKVAATLGGTAINLTSNQTYGVGLVSKLFTGAQYQTYYNAVVADIFSVAPGITIIPDAGNEAWNPAAAYAYHQCRDVISVRASLDLGLGAGNAHYGYGWALHKMWTACDSYYPRAQIIRMYSGQWSYFAGIGSGYAYSDSRYYSGATIANTMDAHCCAGYVHTAMNGGYIWPQDGRNNAGPELSPELTFGDNYYSSYFYLIGERVHRADGTNWRSLQNNNTNHDPATSPTWWAQEASNGLTGIATNWTDAQWLEAYTYGNTVWAERLSTYKTQGNVYRTNPVPLGFITYECGPLNVLDGTYVPGQGAMSIRYKAWTLTTSFRSFLQDMVARVFQANGVTLITYYLDAGDWGSGDGGANRTQAVTYGMKRGGQLPETPGSTYFKSISI